MNDERRKYVRVLFEGGVRVKAGEKWLETKVVDVSLKGLLLEWPFEDELKDGDIYPVEMPLNEGGEVIRMEAALSHVKEGKAGFSWKIIDGESLAHLRTLLSYNISDSEQVDLELRNLVEDVRKEAEENGL